MERVNLNLRTQYITDTEMFRNGTPSNFIIFKKLCGTGATHGEAKVYKRHSIIIVPNTPVLKGKKEAIDENGNSKYPDIFVVYEGVSKQEVEVYLNGQVTFKKILCTPEAYILKVKPAIEENNNFNLFTDFFMLLDECDKITKDADFRYSLVAPLDDFFQFKNKAMISATALIPSDRRFEEHNFKRLYVKPKFNYKQNITIFDTNNIVATLKEELAKVGEEKVFIFLNSVELIQVIIELLQIEDFSKVFCAEKSKVKLIDSGFSNVSTELTDFKKYNFLTCKFFNAVDIDLEEKPNVILITDVLRKAFSMLDPYSDSVQIVGRFRNGIKNAVHISNSNKNLKWKEKQRAISFIKDAYDTYKDLEVMKAITTKEGAIVILTEAMTGSFIHSYIKENGEVDPYLVDGFLLDQAITGYYTHINKLNRAYLHSNFFRPTVIKMNYNINDAHIISMKLKSTASALIQNISEILRANENAPSNGVLNFDLGRSNEVIRKQHADIANFYDVIGFDSMAELEFNKSAIKLKVKKTEKELERNNPKLILKIQSLYKPDETPSEMEIAADFQVIYNDLGICEIARPSHLTRYYIASRTSNDQGIKVWKIKGKKVL
ncbi:DEAD/DEAH box helicase family protein [Pedobacter westerhofensis]|nr:DEAD/DEAH box helicase family protein [Pedobacter westerhofensis]